jgi:co-chaperonin GroES (HSP10)
MSKLLVPKHYAAATAISPDRAGRSVDIETDEFITRTQVAEQTDELNAFVRLRREADPGYHLPLPTGWRISVLLLTLPETTEGGLQVVADAREARALASPQGVVLALGPACYTDPDRFEVPDKGLVPWVKIGDRVTWQKYDLATFKLANRQMIGFLTDTQPTSLLDQGWEVPV